jgi:hypothetical protein
MFSWEEIERDKKQVSVFLKHLERNHPSLYNELIGKELEFPGGKTTLENIIKIMDQFTFFDKDKAKKLVKEYIPDTNTYYDPELLKGLHILLYTTPYTVIEKNIKALVLYLIHQEWPHLKKLENLKKIELENSFEYSGKRRSKNKRKSEHKKMKAKCFR